MISLADFQSLSVAQIIIFHERSFTDRHILVMLHDGANFSGLTLTGHKIICISICFNYINLSWKHNTHSYACVSQANSLTDSNIIIF